MREYELEVLEQYDIEVKGTRKIRGAFFCDTKEGTMLLKEADVSDRRAPLLYLVQKSLEDEGYNEVDTLLHNKEGNLVSVSRDGTRYVLKKWFTGWECDVKKPHEILQASRNLARLHCFMSGKQICHTNSEDTICLPEGRPLWEELDRHNRELKKVRAFMRNKVSKSSFEFLFLEYFDKIYGLADLITKKLEKSGYDTLYRESLEQQKLVHGDYNYHNVIFTQNKIATTNFEHFRVDVQAQDLYYFLRKVMEKHQWSETLGKSMLEAYENERPLDEREWEYMAICLAYPEKFWKIANAYYYSNKAWIPEKNVEKLHTAITQIEEKLRFLENLFTFIL